MKRRRARKYTGESTKSRDSFRDILTEFPQKTEEEEIERIRRKAESYEMSKFSLWKSRARHYITRPGVFFREQCPELGG